MAEFLGSLPWYEEYPTSPPTFILNGFIYSLLGTVISLAEFCSYVIGTVPVCLIIVTQLWGCTVPAVIFSASKTTTLTYNGHCGSPPLFLFLFPFSKMAGSESLLSSNILLSEIRDSVQRWTESEVIWIIPGHFSATYSRPLSMFTGKPNSCLGWLASPLVRSHYSCLGAHESESPAGHGVPTERGRPIGSGSCIIKTYL